MNSKTTDQFWKNYSKLPGPVKKQAKESFRLFLKNPYHPSLNFKRVHSQRPIFSTRISRDYRALGVLHDHEIIWFWIGSHQDYDKLLKQLKSTTKST